MTQSIPYLIKNVHNDPKSYEILKNLFGRCTSCKENCTLINSCCGSVEIQGAIYQSVEPESATKR